MGGRGMNSTVERKMELPPLDGYTSQIEKAEKIRQKYVTYVNDLEAAAKTGILWSSYGDLDNKYSKNPKQYSQMEAKFEAAKRADEAIGNSFLFNRPIPSTVYAQMRDRKRNKTEQPGATEGERIKQELAAARKALKEQNKAYYWVHLR